MAGLYRAQNKSMVRDYENYSQEAGLVQGGHGLLGSKRMERKSQTVEEIETSRII